MLYIRVFPTISPLFCCLYCYSPAVAQCWCHGIVVYVVFNPYLRLIIVFIVSPIVFIVVHPSAISGGPDKLREFVGALPAKHPHLLPQNSHKVRFFLHISKKSSTFAHDCTTYLNTTKLNTYQNIYNHEKVFYINHGYATSL